MHELAKEENNELEQRERERESYRDIDVYEDLTILE